MNQKERHTYESKRKTDKKYKHKNDVEREKQVKSSMSSKWPRH